MPHEPLMRWETEGGALDPANGYEAQPAAADHGEFEPERRRLNERQPLTVPVPALRKEEHS